MFRISTLLVFLLCTVQLRAQNRICGSADHLHDMELSSPAFQNARQLIEQQTQAYVNSTANPQRSTITIPVVVHVVYRLASENISDAQIQSQINILNEDFRKLNPDFNNTPAAFQNVAADCDIQFVLAKRTPNGDSSTGITRTQTTVTAFNMSNQVKYTATGGKDAWPASQYLNIWVCRLSNGLLGYAQFPGGAAATDGVVCSFRAFGNTGAALPPFNKGRTATHEIAHWLNVYHIWGDDAGSCNGTDLVGDTPNQGAEHYGCPSFPSLSCNNGPDGAMFMNFMDYSDDACMSMFTQGQKSRMDALFIPGGARAALLNSLGAEYPSPACGIPSNINTVFVSENDALLSWDLVVGASAYPIRYRIAGDTNWNVLTSSLNAYILGGLNAGTTYEYQLMSNCTSGQSAWSNTQTFTTNIPAPVCALPSNVQTNNITQTSVVISWDQAANSQGYTFRYRTSGSSNWLNIPVSLNTINLNGLNANQAYEFEIENNCSFGNSGYTSTSTFSTLPVPVQVCSDNYENNNLRILATQIQTNSITNSMIGTAGDNDYFKFSTSSAEPKIKIVLSDLPQDYDLKLYKPNGVLIATSQSSSLRMETIILNSAVFGDNYVARVYGYNGIFDNANCYTLEVLSSANNFREDGTNFTEETKPQIYFYPNPASNQITTEVYKSEEDIITCHIYNALGQLVQTRQIEAQTGFNELHFDVSGLSNGFYLFEMIDSQEKNIQKFEVQH